MSAIPHVEDYTTRSPSAKRAEQQAVANDVEEFLARGGTITVLEDNAKADDMRDVSSTKHLTEQLFSYKGEMPDPKDQKVIGMSGASKVMGINLNQLRVCVARGYMTENIPLPTQSKLQNSQIGFTPQACQEWKEKYYKLWVKEKQTAFKTKLKGIN